MTTQRRTFIRMLEAGDIDGCVNIAKVINGTYKHFSFMLRPLAVRTSARILDALMSNPTFPSSNDFYKNDYFNPHKLSVKELDALTAASPDWHRYDFILEQKNLNENWIVSKCETLGWGNAETLPLTKGQSERAAHIMGVRTTRQDVRDALISRWGNKQCWADSYVIETETLIESGRFNTLLVNRTDIDNDMLTQLLGQFDLACAYIRSRKTISRSHAKLLAAHNDLHINACLLMLCDDALNPEFLAACATDSEWDVRDKVAQNDSTPLDTLKVLAFDDVKSVASSAKSNLRRRQEEVPSTKPGSDNYKYIIGLVSDWLANCQDINATEVVKFLAHLQVLLETIKDVPSADECARFAVLAGKVRDMRKDLEEQTTGLGLDPMRLDACLSALTSTQSLQRRYDSLRADIAKLVRKASESAEALNALEATLTSIAETYSFLLFGLPASDPR